jgi:hypothetical protein
MVIWLGVYPSTISRALSPSVMHLITQMQPQPPVAPIVNEVFDE